MPFAAIPHTKPYQQIVFQVSVIKTINDKIVKTKNIVLDPQNISTKDLLKIIDVIYDPDANNYVVFNKTYEHSRLNEILKLIAKTSLHSEYQKKVNDITQNKSIDLYDLFRTNVGKNKMPPIFLHELKGFSSIKKIENYINTHNYNLEVMIEPYKSLEIQNGLMAMNKAIQRYLGSIGNNEWYDTVQYLEQYCENDVKAMIMVYFFIKEIYQTELNKNHN